MLFGGDALIVLVCSLIAFYLRFHLLSWEGENSNSTIALQHYATHIGFGCFVMYLILYLNGMYRIDMLSRYRYASLRMGVCALYWAAFFVSFSLIFKIDPSISRLWVLLAAIVSGVGLVIWRYTFCKQMIGRTLLKSIRRKTIIVGWSARANAIYERSEQSNSTEEFFPFSINAVVMLNEGKAEEEAPPASIHQGTSFSRLEQLLASGRYDTVIVANSDMPHLEALKLQELCGRELVDYMMIPDFISTMTSCLHVESFRGHPLLTQTKRELTKTSSTIIKRTFDIVGSLIGLLVFAPVVAYFCWRVYRESPGPVFYRQTRLGKNGRPFTIIKIRSMRVDAENETGVTWCTEVDPRRLRIGEFMRKHNIDELPQFWNVLQGEMSLVGPRPERPELIVDFKHEISFYNLRHTVKPGITGWAQINGWRGDTCLESRVACDIEYIERWSPWLDLYICLRTLWSTKNAY